MSTSPKIVLLDGPSASGKSRLKRALLEQVSGLQFCPRITTRPKRDSDSDSDYDFVSPAKFEQLERAGKLAAWRHFDFSMSYGLPTEPVNQAISAGRDVLALIDLGTISQAKLSWPSSFGVLLFVPVDQLRQRLEARKSHSKEQIEERLGNAERVWQLRDLYDLVLINEEGAWEDTIEKALSIFRRPKK